MKIARPDDKTIFGTWIAGYESRDVAKVMSIFADDIQYHAPCQPAQDFAALESWFKYDFSRKDPRPSWSFKTDSIDVSGDLAVIVSRWSAVTNLDGFSANLERLRSIDFLRYGEQGWKIFRTINDPENCGTPPKLARDKKSKKDKKRSKKR